MRQTRIEGIFHLHFAVLGVDDGVGSDGCFEKPLVVHCFQQLVSSRSGQGGVVDDRRLSELTNPAVPPFCGVASAHVIDAETEFRAPKHFMVGQLAKISRHFLFVESLCRIVDLYFDRIEKQASLGDMARTAASPSQKEKQREEEKYMVSFIINQNSALEFP